MKNSTTKILLAIFISIIGFGKVNAQTSDNLIHAFFKGTDTDVKNDIKSNTLTFFVSGLSTKELADAFLKKALPYSKSFTMTMARLENPAECEFKITFIGTPELKWVLRFFLASGVKDVEQNSIKKDPSNFFKPYM